MRNHIGKIRRSHRPFGLKPPPRLLDRVTPLLRMTQGHHRAAAAVEMPEVLDLETLVLRRLHHAPGGFCNPWLSRRFQPADILKRWEGNRPRRPAGAPAAVPLSPEAAAALPPPAVTFLGHSTLWFRMGAADIITDPVLGNIFPVLPRLQAPPCPPEALPPMDVVLLSHAHRDHLDLPTLRRLRGRYTIVAPLGFRPFLRHWHRRGRLLELDWFESVTIKGVRLTCLPAQHWSRRRLRDTNRSLWASWLLEAAGCRAFFSGDSGYFHGFHEIGRKFGPVDLACLPAGAYEPRWFLQPVHMSPEEAVQAGLDLRAGRILPIHWGTFPLGDDPPGALPDRFRQACRRLGLAEAATPVLRPGETLRLGDAAGGRP
ncbi:MBL fold metallo-hydrolase [Dissulfurirhabdus thermomarina]|uniref:MBL fold metallo-hydrolase n=1 Tax=Dissulfurirhabdus thermomarina TaxID=1765737 RepID=A0A6N9TS54_DISTH|nr:MBL fold metallo-hydrolase [Dissulfurirhabdus thermomarina]NDY42277.1 MBL fold metallo-hydrolase [Dissulfurirhabdus thermomarina]